MRGRSQLAYNRLTGKVNLARKHISGETWPRRLPAKYAVAFIRPSSQVPYIGYTETWSPTQTQNSHPAPDGGHLGGPLWDPNSKSRADTFGENPVLLAVIGKSDFKTPCRRETVLVSNSIPVAFSSNPSVRGIHPPGGRIFVPSPSVIKFRMLTSKRFLDGAIPANRKMCLKRGRDLFRPEFAPFRNRAVGSHKRGLVVRPIDGVERFLTKHALLVRVPLRQDAFHQTFGGSSLNLADTFLGTTRPFGPARTTSKAEFRAIPNCCPPGMKCIDDNPSGLMRFRAFHNARAPHREKRPNRLIRI